MMIGSDSCNGIYGCNGVVMYEISQTHLSFVYVIRWVWGDEWEIIPIITLTSQVFALIALVMTGCGFVYSNMIIILNECVSWE